METKYLNYLNDEWQKIVDKPVRPLSDIIHQIESSYLAVCPDEKSLWAMAAGLGSYFGEQGRELFYLCCKFSHQSRNSDYCRHVYDSVLQSKYSYGHTIQTVIKLFKKSGIII